MFKISVKSNIVLLYIFSFLIKRPMMPIITLYYLFFNLSFTQIGIIAGATALTALIFEIPSGIVTDYIGKRTALIIGSIFGFISQFLYFIGDSFIIFLIAGIVFGVSISFISGTRRSLLFETLRKLDKKDMYKKYNGKMVFYSFIFNGVILFLVPFIYEVNKKYVFLISMLFFIFAIITSLLMREVIGRTNAKLSRHVRESFIQTLENKKIFLAILYNITGGSVIFFMVDYFQPIMKSAGILVVYFGVIYFLMRLFMAIGSKFAYLFEKHLSNERIVIISLFLYSLILIGFTTLNIYFIIFLIVFMRFIQGVFRVVSTDELHKNIGDSNRTTIASISNMYRNGFHMLLAPIIGILVDSHGVRYMVVILGLFYLFITFMVIGNIRKYSSLN